MSEIEKNRILAKRLRNNIMEVLELWSSKEAQLKYQKEVSIAQVSSELFNQWETFFDPESEQLQYGFSSNKKSILMDFNSLINHILNKSYDIPYIT